MNSPRPLSPARALLHPLWLGALAALATNDHFLKGAGLLPGAVTGKLSDFAGMLVAPALLATLLRVRTTRALAACHVAVGAVFAAIQVARPAAELWSALMAAVAVPWAITSDPTDLVALPMLLVSHRVLGSAMQTPARRVITRCAQWSAASVGLVFCVATSPANPPEYAGGLFLYNDTDETITVQVQRLREGLAFDCSALAEAPGRLLSPSLFGVAAVYDVQSAAALDLWNGPRSQQPPVRSCDVVRVSITGLSRTFLIPVDDESYPGDVYADDEVRNEEAPVVVVASGDDGLHVSPGPTVTLEEEAALLVAGDPGACPGQSDADRLAWDVSNLSAARRIEDVAAGPDGCLRIDLRTQEAIDAGDPADANYLCIPEELFPFAVGDWVTVDNLGVGVVMRAAGPEGGPAPEHLELLAARAYPDGTVTSLPADLVLSASPDRLCNLAVYDTCGSVARPAVVEALRTDLGGARSVAVGTTEVLDGADGSTMEVTVLHALDRRVVDTECVVGPADVGFDIEVVVLYRRPSP